jgi:predicted phage baseplate assembly protein
MPLEAPKLDTRTFESLLSEARLRIPRYTPEWTDFNDSDPGMTLVQLFAWLTEMTLFELNRVPELTRVNFLKLIGRDLRPAQPATAQLTFTVQDGASQIDPVPRGTQVMGMPADGSAPLIFETTEGLDLIRPKLDRIRVFDGSNYLDAQRAFPAFGWVPQIGNALYLGFAAPPNASPPGAPFPQQMRFRIVLAQTSDTPAPVSSRDLRQPARPPAQLVWEYNASASPAPRWIRLDTAEDTSVAFTRDGDIIVEGPPATIPPSVAAGVIDARYWLRCRLASGGYPAGLPPQIDQILPNTIRAENLSTIRDEVVGISEGYRGQVFKLNSRPVQPGSLELTVAGADEQPEPWLPQPDFFRSGPDDRHYTFSEATGEITFGNGSQGRIPNAGAEIVAQRYRFGGGTAGNLPAGSINALLTPITGVSEVTNNFPAVGGAGEESVDDAEKEAPRFLRSRNRAVTAEDFALIAREAGGVAKATAIELAHPDFPGVEIPGAVQVVIVPLSGDIHDRSPMPSPDQLRSVCEYLDRFRLITTELTVTGPVYKAVSVQARIETRRYASLDQVERDVRDAIDEYLDPLGRTYRRTEPSRTDLAAPRPGQVVAPQTDDAEPGWLFGKELYRSSLFGVILQLPDVVAVSDLRLLIDNKPMTDLDRPISVKRNELVFSTGDHGITVQPARDL